MADPPYIAFVENLLTRTDSQIRDIVANTRALAAEVDDIEIILGDGTAVVPTGVHACIRVDFQARITGSFVQEFEGTSGSIVLDIAKAPAGASPTFASIVASAPPTISSGRYAANETLIGWTTLLDRGDLLRFSVTSATTIKRVLLTLRIRRLEP